MTELDKAWSEFPVPFNLIGLHPGLLESDTVYGHAWWAWQCRLVRFESASRTRAFID